MQKKGAFGISISKTKSTVVSVLLVANAFVWYATILTVLESNFLPGGEESWLDPNSQTIVWCVHFAGLILAALAGASLSRKFNRTKFLVFWMILNVAASATLFVLDNASLATAAFLALFYGVSFGIGMPACMSNYSDSIPTEKRGRVSGMVMLVSGIAFFALGVLPLGLFEIGVALSVWRFVGLILLLIVQSSIIVDRKKGADSFLQILTKRSFIAYYIPWVMFSFVNFLVPLQPSLVGETAEITLLIQTIFLAIFAVMGGFFLDSVGRKKIAIIGFIMLGLSAAVRGIDSTSLSSLYFSAIFEGTAWGLLLVLFLLTLWGDLSYALSSDKYYALGVMPFFISMLIGLTLGKQIANDIPSANLFSLAALFLFVAVLPLFYAPETLPEKVMKDRDLKSYVEKAKKKMQRESEKTQGTEDTPKPENDKKETDTPPTENDGEYEKAQELAEKYY